MPQAIARQRQRVWSEDGPGSPDVLLSGAAAFVTGAELVIDGGLTAQ
jgi:hypothetical protein